MKRGLIATASTFSIAAAITLGAAAAWPADDGETQTLATQTSQMDSLAAKQGGTKVSGKISSDFSDFAGSSSNSDALVGGLRNGTAITLRSTDAKGVTTSTTFTPPTGKMGYGNVYTSLALAKQQLAGLGITDPSAQQIQAALAGGIVTGANGQTTALTGVLTLRAQGMGWGQIAHTLGYKLGPVISGMKSANAHVASQQGASARSQAATATGVTKAVGTSAGHGNAYGRGITTGAGTPAGQGQGNAYGRGIVTGAGSAPGQSGAATHGRSVGKGN